MARADRRQATRTRSAARSRSEYALIEESLFFTRIRRHAKIVFVFIALVFAVGFVIFGVGSGGGVGLGDILQGGGSSSNGPSVEDAQKKLRENPSDAAALRELSTAYERDGKAAAAIPPLQRYVKLRPKDTVALRDLASLYVAKATRLRNQAAGVQAQGSIVTAPTDVVPPTGTSPLDQALGAGTITQQIQQDAQQRLTNLVTEMQGAYGQAVVVYRKLGRATPSDPSLQLQLADAAVNANNVNAALAAYRSFLKLAPDDPNAPLVRKEIKRLQQQKQATGGG